MTGSLASVRLPRSQAASRRRGGGPAVPAAAAAVARAVWAGPLSARLAGACALAVLAGVVVGPAAAAAAGAILFLGPGVALRVRQDRRRRAFEAQLVTLIELLARRLGAGASLRQALGAAAAVPEPTGALLRDCRDSMELGEAPVEAVAALAVATASPLYELLGVSLALHERSGGDVVATLRRLAGIVRDRRAAELEVRSVTSQGRLSGLVVGLAPLAMSFVVKGAGDAHLPAWLSAAVELVGWSLVAVGVWLIWRISDPERLLVPARGGAPRGERPPPRLLVAAGRRIPRRLAGTDRSRRLLTARGVARPDPERLAAVGGFRVLSGALGFFVPLCLWRSPAGIAAAVCGAAAGWLCVEWSWAREAADARAGIESELAQACDMLALALGAGLNLHRAVARVGDLLGGPLGRRLRRARDAVAWGEAEEAALGAVADGAGSDDLTEVVATLLEARRRGGALAGVLDDLAADMRRREHLRRDAAARRLPVKILFPLVLLVLPAFVLLTVVPLAGAVLAGFAR